MVERINFLVNDRWMLTYRNMAIALGGWVGCCLLIQCVLMIDTAYVRHREQSLQERIRLLTVRQEEQLQLLAASSSREQADTAMQSLASIFSQAPRWSPFVRGLGEARPSALALVRVVGKIDERMMAQQLMLEGYAIGIEGINEFVERLNALAVYRDARLLESRRDAESGRLRFVIELTGERGTP